MGISVKEWREQQRAIRTEGLPLELPSGLTVYVRNTTLAAVLTADGVPDSLTPIVAKLLSGGVEDIEKTGLEKILLADSVMSETVCRLTIISPRIVKNPQADDEIAIEDLDSEDRRVLRGLVELPARRLDSFCQEQKIALAALYAGEAVADESEQTPEPETVEPESDGYSGERHLDSVPV